MQRDGTSHGGRSALWRLGARIRNSPVVVGALSAIPTDGAIVLRYHSVNDDPGWEFTYLQRSLSVPPSIFDQQMQFLKRHRRVVGIDELSDLVRSGSRVDPRVAAVTFDDGYEDNFRNALPILRSHGLTAAFYVTSGCIGDAEILWTVRLRHVIRNCRRGSLALSFAGERALDVSSHSAMESAIRLLTGIVKRSSPEEARDMLREVEEACGAIACGFDRRIMMNEEEIRQLAAAGMTVGAHTVSHYNLPCLTTRDVARELGDSKRRLESIVGGPVDHLAYPDGRTGRHFDGRVARVAAMSGFKSAVTSVAGPASRRFSEYSIPRLGVVRKHRNLSRLAADMQYARFSRPGDGVFDEVRSMSNGDTDEGGGARPRPIVP